MTDSMDKDTELLRLKNYISALEELLAVQEKSVIDQFEQLIAEQDALKKVQQQLVQSEKMAAIGQLAGGVAHEINNPLAVILGYAQLSAREIKEGDKLYKPIKTIEKEALRCKNLIVDLLAYSRTGKSEMKMADLNETIEQAMSLVSAQAKIKVIEITKCYDLSLLPVLLNQNKIQQIIINLCNNAIDAVPENGKITIITKKTDKYAEIDIADNGNGIPEEVKKHVFEPFFTTKEAGKGTGPGLSLVYEAVMMHRGTIEIENNPGGGTVFKIKLPLEQK